MEAFVLIVYILFVVAALFHPFIGLYGFFIIAYVRPQDFNPVLADIEPAKIILIVTLISFLFQKIVKRESVMKARQNWFIIGIFLFILISRIRAIDIDSWWMTTEDFIRIVLVFFIFTNLIITEKKLKIFYVMFLLLNLIIALRFYISYRNGNAMMWGTKPGDASFGFLGNADDLGVGLVVALPFALMPIFYVRNIFIKGICALISVCFMLGALVTHSRGALLGVFVVFIATLLFQLKMNKLRQSKYAIGLVIALFLFAVFNVKYRYTINDQYVSAQSEGDPGRLGRMSTWDVARQMVQANPLTGVGRGNYVAHWMANYAPGIYGYQVAHNIMWQVAAEIGLIGLLFFLLFSLSGVIEIRKFSKKYREILEHNEFLGMIFTIYLISLIGFFVNGMFITVAFYWHVYVLVAMFVCAKTIFMNEVTCAARPAK